jgi:hypothetical protein
MKLTSAKTSAKIALSLFIILSSLTGFCQALTYGNFRVDNQQLVYQKIFLHDSITSEKLGAYIASLPFISDLDRSDNEMKFRINDFTVDFKKFGFNEVTAAPIIQSGKFSGEGSIDMKDGKYRITLFNLQLTGNIVYKRITSKESLTTYACRNSGTSISPDWTKPNTLGLLDKALTDKLQFVENAGIKKDNDW